VLAEEHPVEFDSTQALRIVNPTHKFDGIYLVDGFPVDQAAVLALDPKTILSIEVVKGPTAAARYNDPFAAKGVISVTTRSKRN
jgi:hypothetical protein